jgi:hypothetical protein
LDLKASPSEAVVTIDCERIGAGDLPGRMRFALFERALLCYRLSRERCFFAVLPTLSASATLEMGEGLSVGVIMAMALGGAVCVDLVAVVVVFFVRRRSLSGDLVVRRDSSSAVVVNETLIDASDAMVTINDTAIESLCVMGISQTTEEVISSQ